MGWITTTAVLLGTSATVVSGTARQDEAAEGIRVRVIDAETQDPVPHASVLSFEGRARTWQFRLHLDSYRDPLFYGGTELLADERGELALPDATEPRILWTTSGSAWAKTIVPADADGLFVLALVRTEPVRVLVTDVDGAPSAGVEVALQFEEDPDGFWGALKATSNSQGIATFDLAGAVKDLAPESRWRVALAFPHRPVVTAPVDMHAPPREAVPLVCPPTGVLELRAEDVEGDPSDGTGIAWVAASLPGEDPWITPVDRHYSARVVSNLGSLRVGLGVDLEAYMEYFPGGSVRLPGPNRPGETVQAVLRRAPYLHLSARAVDSDGRPFAGAKLRAYLRHYRKDGRGADRFDVTTSPDGTFDVSSVVNDREFLHRVLYVSTDDGLGGSKEIPNLPRIGRVSLGDIELAKLPVLARGRVVSPTGEAVSGARVALSSALEEVATVRSERDGAFEVRALLPEQVAAILCWPLGVSARKKGYSVSRTALAPRGGPIELRLGELRRITGILVPPDGARSSCYGARSSCLGVRLRSGEWGEVAADGTFEIETAPGVVQLEVNVECDCDGFGDEPILVSEVDTTGEDVDVRLEPIDLSKHARFVTVKVLTADGEPATGEFWVTEPGDTEPLSYYLPFFQGKIELFVGLEERGLTVYAAGHKMASVTPLEREMTIRLEAQ